MEKKNLIPIYSDEKAITLEYIKSTIIETELNNIKLKLYKYKNQIGIEQVVCDVVDKILFNKKLLNKVVLVSDLNYRNCAIKINNKSITVLNSGGYSNLHHNKYTYTELLKHFEDKATKIFILLDNKVKINSIKKDNKGIDITWATIDNPINDIAKYFFGIDLANDADMPTHTYSNNKGNDEITDEELNIVMLKGELSAINDKINKCLDVSLIDNCDEKKYFYNTMFDELCKEKKRVQNKLNDLNK